MELPLQMRTDCQRRLRESVLDFILSIIKKSPTLATAVVFGGAVRDLLDKQDIQGAIGDIDIMMMSDDQCRIFSTHLRQLFKVTKLRNPDRKARYAVETLSVSPIINVLSDTITAHIDLVMPNVPGLSDFDVNTLCIKSGGIGIFDSLWVEGRLTDSERLSLLPEIMENIRTKKANLQLCSLQDLRKSGFQFPENKMMENVTFEERYYHHINVLFGVRVPRLLHRGYEIINLSVSVRQKDYRTGPEIQCSYCAQWGPQSCPMFLQNDGQGHAISMTCQLCEHRFTVFEDFTPVSA
jgi:hypothetical protein